MPFGYSLKAADPIAAIRREIAENRLHHERKRLDQARKNLEFYRGDFERYPPRPGGSDPDYAAAGPPRYSLVMQCVVDALTAHLYCDGPVRTLADHPQASKWLNAVYRANAADALWQHADALTCVSDVALIEVRPQGEAVAVGPEPAHPVRLLVWDASQFCVWEDPDDQTRVIAVAVIDLYNEQRRLTLWTEETVTTYMTKEWSPVMTAGGMAYFETARRPNDFGVIPFASVHYDLPVCDFWTRGPGDYLQGVNEGFNFALTQNSDSIQFNLRPILTGHNVRPGWQTPKPMRPGMVLFPAADTDSGGENDRASLEYLQADSSFVAASWDDFNQYLDHVYEVCGVPKAFVRMDQDSVRSGASIVAEQERILKWAKGRQRAFVKYEDALAKLVLTVGARHLGAQDFGGYRATAAQLEAAAADPGLTVRWPKFQPELYGAERDQSDQSAIEMGLASRVTVLMTRGLTREEARAHLEQVEEDREWERKLFGEPEPGADDGDDGNGKPGANGKAASGAVKAKAKGEEDDGDDDADAESE